MKQAISAIIAATIMGATTAFGQAAPPAPSPGSPFVIGEAFPDTPASCDSLPGWLYKAPEYDGRISMAVRGELTASESDGVLAYLFMCPAEKVQVVCITYEEHEVIAGKQVLLAGGFAGVGDGQVVLDPCLAYDAPPG
ncbi:hypothetical protein ACFSC1_19005 [Paracoccus aurantiacus]|uniref:hypothetical protein n=1 Tax=Paracoccus aurantiacus TaxID=2599412 RepID=UPI00363E0A1C